MHHDVHPMLGLLARIDTQRAAILTMIAAIPPNALRARPATTGWSALDVLEHLVLAEQVVLGDLSTVDSRPDDRPSPRDRIRSRIVWLVLRFGVRVHADSRMLPAGTGTFQTWRDRWDTQHAALRASVTQMDAAALTRHVFRHPIGGPLTPPQALQLLSAHLRTHTRQLTEISRMTR